MFSRKISLVAIVAAGLSGTGAAFLAFGPDLLINFMTQDDNRMRDEAALRQNQLLERNALLLEGLAETLQQRPVEASLSQGPVSVPAPEHEPLAAATPEEVLQPDTVAVRGGDRTEQAQVPELPADVPPPVASAAPVDTIISFGVYPGQEFDLCGYGNFTAEILTADAAARVSLRSTERAIPGAGFRGFAIQLPLREASQLWEGCTVAVDLAEGAGTTRIAISTSTGTLL